MSTFRNTSQHHDGSIATTAFHFPVAATAAVALVACASVSQSRREPPRGEKAVEQMRGRHQLLNNASLIEHEPSRADPIGRPDLPVPLNTRTGMRRCELTRLMPLLSGRIRGVQPHSVPRRSGSGSGADDGS
ncbi:hypothetical protein Landi51_04788 [Colletotrichum acutatum]